MTGEPSPARQPVPAPSRAPAAAKAPMPAAAAPAFMAGKDQAPATAPQPTAAPPPPQWPAIDVHSEQRKPEMEPAEDPVESVWRRQSGR